VRADYIATHQPAIAARDDLLGNADLGVYPIGERYLVYVPAILKTNNFQIRRQLIAALKILRARR